MKKLIISTIIIILLIFYCSSPEENGSINYDNLETSTKSFKSFKKKHSTKNQNINNLKKDDNQNKSKGVSTNYYVVKDINSLKYRFNKFFRNSKSPLRIRSLQIKSGEIFNTITYMFNDNIGLNCSVNKIDNSIREITMIGQGDGSLESGLNIIIVMGGIISSTNPSLKAHDRGEILSRIGFLEDNVDINNLDSKTIRNNIKYWINSSKYIGIMFGASHIKN